MRNLGGYFFIPTIELLEVEEYKKPAVNFRIGHIKKSYVGK